MSDNGTGMSPEVAQRAMEAFFTTKPRGMGTGLGLWIAQRFASTYGGKVSLETAIGQGTTVRLSLPYAGDVEQVWPAFTAAAGTSHSPASYVRDKIEEPLVSRFVVVGIGAQAQGPIEKVALTATEAEVERSALERLCGKHGKVEVLGQDGRSITPGKLRRLARNKAASHHSGSEALNPAR